MSAIRPLGILNAPDGYVGRSGTDFVVAARAPIGLERAGSGDGRHLVVMPIRTRLDTAKHQNSRNSSLSIPRIES